jgi:hypothetical protein
MLPTRRRSLVISAVAGPALLSSGRTPAQGDDRPVLTVAVADAPAGDGTQQRRHAHRDGPIRRDTTR